MADKKFVRVDARTVIEVPVTIPDDEAIENYLYRTRHSPRPRTIADEVITKETKEELETVLDDYQPEEDAPPDNNDDDED